MPRPVARRDRPSRGEVQRDLRRAILDATERLLVDHRFDELRVAHILSAAKVSRASFYFYNTMEEIDRMIEILHIAVRFFSPKEGRSPVRSLS